MTCPRRTGAPGTSGVRRVRLRTVAVVLPAVLLAGGCATGADPSTAPHASHGTSVRAVPAAAAEQAESAPADAVALRSRLEELLGAHILLADELVRAVVAGDQQQASATADAVTSNQQQLVSLVRSLDGPEAADPFETAWQRHVELLGQYATALAQDDTAKQQATRGAYTQAEQQLGAALATVVGGAVSIEALTAAATMHGQHLLDQADAFAAGDYDRAYTLQREAFTHMIAVADVLARGVAEATGMPTGEIDAPRRELQSALSRLLAEHMGLMVQAMRAADDSSPDFRAVGRALNANTADLGGAVGTLYGEQAGQQFLDLWAQHVEALVSYASATEQERAAARQASRAQLEAFAPELARFLAGATEQRLPVIDLAAAVTEHDEHLLAQADAYAADDHAEAQRLSAIGYAHMFGLAQTLATAIGDAVASRLPQGGAATGGGGLAGRR